MGIDVEWSFEERKLVPFDRKSPPVHTKGWGTLKYVCPVGVHEKERDSSLRSE